MEGYKEGIIVEVFPVIQAHKNKNGIYDLNMKTKGWASKEECIKLTKQGALDLIVCHSPQGHEYLRARLGSSINDSLDKLVIKDHNEKNRQKNISRPMQGDKEKVYSRLQVMKEFVNKPV